MVKNLEAGARFWIRMARNSAIQEQKCGSGLVWPGLLPSRNRNVDFNQDEQDFYHPGAEMWISIRITRTSTIQEQKCGSGSG
ncbi:hypothetical protein HNY73_013209 [Argiope bruennichi]|uniref:Uncharacterized protein n=1 Tax=Argiope bruennichi TaxID=94029 RepID=A0A8T0F242_ARGBR|nr:hypothetical protein HNY73_013209 [Argiope bruennichi]